MTKPMIRIHDMATNEIIDREMNDAEYADYQAQEAKDKAITQALEQAATDKAALLAKMGLTADELKILLT